MNRPRIAFPGPGVVGSGMARRPLVIGFPPEDFQRAIDASGVDKDMAAVIEPMRKS